MIQIITIPTDREPVMIVETLRIQPWARTHGWIYTAYSNEGDHLVQIAAAGGGKSLGILDFDCHGSPTSFDHTYPATVAAFAKALPQLSGFSVNTQIYLDACNTGLTSFAGGPVAQDVANIAGCTVYGCKGYLRGTYAENTEICYASLGGGVGAYPGARDATGRDVWIPFGPVRAAGAPKEIKATNLLVMASTINLREDAPDVASKELVAVIDSALETEPVDFPRLRMAPDMTINFGRGNEVRILDVYANGALIRDRTNGLAWRVPSGRLLQFQLAMRTSLGLE